MVDNSTYNDSEYYFQNAGWTNAPLHALKDGADGSNGVYIYSFGGVFPNLGLPVENDWVDMVFRPFWYRIFAV